MGINLAWNGFKEGKRGFRDSDDRHDFQGPLLHRGAVHYSGSWRGSGNQEKLGIFSIFLLFKIS